MGIEDNIRDLDRLRSLLDPFVKAHEVLGTILALEEDIVDLENKKAKLAHEVANAEQVLIGHQNAVKTLAEAVNR